jgi:hypothetical protein
MIERSAETMERREDFPIDSFRHLEKMLQGIRRRIMVRAAEFAEQENPGTRLYQVTRAHVDRALRELLNDPRQCNRAVGLDE